MWIQKESGPPPHQNVYCSIWCKANGCYVNTKQCLMIEQTEKHTFTSMNFTLTSVSTKRYVCLIHQIKGCMEEWNERLWAWKYAVVRADDNDKLSKHTYKQFQDGLSTESEKSLRVLLHNKVHSFIHRKSWTRSMLHFIRLFLFCVFAFHWLSELANCQWNVYKDIPSPTYNALSAINRIDRNSNSTWIWCADVGNVIRSELGGLIFVGKWIIHTFSSEKCWSQRNISEFKRNSHFGLWIAFSVVKWRRCVVFSNIRRKKWHRIHKKSN